MCSGINTKCASMFSHFSRALISIYNRTLQFALYTNFHCNTQTHTVYTHKGSTFAVLYYIHVAANCSYLNIPILTPQKGVIFTLYPYFWKNLSVVLYRKFRNIPILKIFLSFVPIS